MRRPNPVPSEGGNLVKQLESPAYSVEQTLRRRPFTTEPDDSELDLLGAITLIATVVEDRAGQQWPAPKEPLLAQCLIMAGALREQINDTLLRDFRQLYLRRQLPLEMTRDAAMILYAAHRSTLMGSSDRIAFAAAVRIAGRMKNRC
jgi:hypothetical protein